MRSLEMICRRPTLKPYGDLLTRDDYPGVIGVRWNQGQPNPACQQINFDGDCVIAPPTWFDQHPIYGQIKRCNLSDAGVINAFWGDGSFSYTGSNGQVMVRHPKMFYRSQKSGNEYEWYVSDERLNNFKVHPGFVTDGRELNAVYLGAFEASVYDVTASATEVNTITITAEPTSSGNLTITLDGNYAFTVAILDADTIEGVVDKIVAAGNKTSFQGTVWTVSKVDASHVRYTADSAGLKTTMLMPTVCGVTSTIVKTTSGAGGYVKNDAGGVDMTATTGDILCSVAGVKPASGWNNATLTLPNFRVLAHNRGAGWELQNFNQASATQLLYLIQYANFNSQTTIGAGVTAITDATAGTTFNNAINTGFTAGVGTNGVDLGNSSGECPLVTHYKTGEAAKANSQFGIENNVGNIWTWVDGININADWNPWIADHDFASDTFAHPYVNPGLVNSNVDGYVTNIGFGAGLDYGFLPSISGGGSTTYLCDYYYQATGNRAVLFGGYWASGGAAGAFHWYLKRAASVSSRDVGARVAYIPPG